MEEKNECIEDYVTRLVEQHREKFIKVQYRLWVELLDVGTHKRLDDPPPLPMFSGAKAGKPNKKTELAHAFTEMAS